MVRMFSSRLYASMYFTVAAVICFISITAADGTDVIYCETYIKRGHQSEPLNA